MGRWQSAMCTAAAAPAGSVRPDERPLGWLRLTAVEPTYEQARRMPAPADLKPPSPPPRATVLRSATVAFAREPGRCRHGPSPARLARGCGPGAPPWPPSKPTPNRPPAAERRRPARRPSARLSRGGSPPTAPPRPAPLAPSAFDILLPTRGTDRLGSHRGNSTWRPTTWTHGCVASLQVRRTEICWPPLACRQAISGPAKAQSPRCR
jgi:hypothetical protein